MIEKPRIGIIGAGVNGVGSAVAILKAFPGLPVTVYSDQFTPDTTGDGAAGLWTPFILPGTSPERVIKWSKATWDLFNFWWKERKVGVFLTSVRKISREELRVPVWKHLPLNFKEYTQDDLKEFGSEYINGHTYDSFIAEPTRFLPYLSEVLTSLGGKFETRRLTKLQELCNEADILVNCSGINSYNLVPDEKVYPIRGQIMRVSGVPIKNCTFDYSQDSFAYIIPNNTCTILGGTHQENNWNTEVDENDSRTIWKNCTRVEPSLKDSNIVKEWAGLRPARKGGARLEEDYVYCNYTKVPIVHNYGHGGSGITTFWGCSLEVKDLVGNIINRHYAPIQSRL